MSTSSISSFGELIRSFREAKGLPLRSIATKLDIDPYLLGKIERNKRKETKGQIKKLAEIFNKDENDLLSENLSDQIAYKIIEEESDIAVLKVAEEKVNYLKKKNG